jgi:phosphoglycolate phosphatase
MFGKASQLRAVRRRLEVPGSEAVYLGDELRDAEAARDAGLRFAAVTWGQHHAAVLRSVTPDFVFDHVGEIAPALSR